MSDEKSKAWDDLHGAAEDYVKGYDGPGTAGDAETRLRLAALAYAAAPPRSSNASPCIALRCPECGDLMTSHVVVTRHATGPCTETYTGPELYDALDAQTAARRSGSPSPFGSRCPGGDACENKIYLDEYRRVDAEHAAEKARRSSAAPALTNENVLAAALSLVFDEVGNACGRSPPSVSGRSRLRLLEA